MVLGATTLASAGSHLSYPLSLGPVFHRDAAFAHKEGGWRKLSQPRAYPPVCLKRVPHSSCMWLPFPLGSLSPLVSSPTTLSGLRTALHKSTLGGGQRADFPPSQCRVLNSGGLEPWKLTVQWRKAKMGYRTGLLYQGLCAGVWVCLRLGHMTPKRQTKWCSVVMGWWGSAMQTSLYVVMLVESGEWCQVFNSKALDRERASSMLGQNVLLQELPGLLPRALC